MFWNINKKHLASELRTLCDDYNIDVLILAENEMKDGEILPILNKGNDRIFLTPFNPSTKISFYIRYPERFLELVDDYSWGAIRKLKHPLGTEILLVGIHAPSKLHLNETEQLIVATEIVNEIDRREQAQGHTRTLVIGDFNMNPFEVGMINSHGFHAVMDKNIALKHSRTVLKQEKKYFYNPMWNCLGDAADSIGTYFYNSGSPTNYFWHTFDQVLLRPSLLAGFNHDDLKVIDTIGNSSLIKNGKINKNQFSDHLPLTMKLKVSNLNLGEKNDNKKFVG